MDKKDDADKLWKEKVRIKKKITIKSAVVSFLEYLWDAAGNLAETAGSGRNINPYGGTYPSKEYSRLLSECKRNGYIRHKKTRNQESIVLTDKARLKIVDKIVNSEACDGKFRFISYDIPENLKTNRNKFRRSIKRMGFIQIQKSLWVCNRNVGDLVEVASYEYGVEKYVAYIISEKSDIDGIIEKKLRQK